MRYGPIGYSRAPTSENWETILSKLGSPRGLSMFNKVRLTIHIQAANKEMGIVYPDGR